MPERRVALRSLLAFRGSLLRGRLLLLYGGALALAGEEHCREGYGEYERQPYEERPRPPRAS